MEDRFHVLAAVDWENVQRFGAEIPLGADSLLVGDPDQGEPHEVFTRSGASYAPVPLRKMAKGIEDGRANMLLLGLVAELAGLPDDAVVRAVEKTLEKRPAALAPSLAAVAAGRAAAATITQRFTLAPPPPHGAL